MTDNIINPPDYRNDTVLPLPMEVTANAWAVDAACSGNPGPMEYQAIDLATGAQVFHFGPVHGTNNIGEFLAIVHALALLDRQGVTGKTIYSDSHNAILWVQKRQCKTKLLRHTADRTALSNHCTRRELAPHAPDKEPYREVGDKKMGRSAGGFRKKRIAACCCMN